jgi:hypothetical protein
MDAILARAWSKVRKARWSHGGYIRGSNAAELFV